MTIQLNTETTATFLNCYPATGLLNTNAAQTIMFWTNPSSVGVVNTQSQLGLYNGNTTGTGTTTAIQLGIRNTTGLIVVWTWGGAVLVQASGFTATTNTWYHVAYTCTSISGSNQTHSLYINGVLNNNSTNATQMAGTLTQVYLNGYPGSGGIESSTTMIDDVYLFNRQLSASEILTIYNTTGQKDGEVYGLVSRYDFNELNSGATVVRCTDFSGNNTIIPTVATGGTPFTYILDHTCSDTRPPL